MAWSDSRVFDQFILGALDRTTTFDVDGDTFKVALYDNDITPDRTVSLANSATNVGQWAYTGNEVTDASGWPSGGRPLVSNDVTTSSGTVTIDANDTASANSTTTLTANYGCHVWDDTITTPTADPGMSFHYFGGSNSVTGGLYTIVWHANGLVRFTT